VFDVSSCRGDNVEPSTDNSRKASCGIVVKGFVLPNTVLIIPLMTLTS
jgi:hypothetical protein